MVNYIEGVIFDLDGTLIISDDVYTSIENGMFTENGMEVPEEFDMVRENILNNAQKDQYRKIDEYIINKIGLDITPEELKKIKAKKAERFYLEEAFLNKGVEEFIELLNEKGIPFGIATANYRKNLDKIIERHEVLNNVSCSFTCDECDNNKPHPELYEKNLKKLNISPNKCAAFEDTIRGVKSAHAAGIEYIYCIEEEVKEEEKEWMRKNGVVLISGFNEVMEIFEKEN